MNTSIFEIFTSAKELHAAALSGSPAFESQNPSRLLGLPLPPDARECALLLPAGRTTRSSRQCSSPHRRSTVASVSFAARSSHKLRVHLNDVVALANRAGTWTVVAPANGSKADIRRSGGFDTRIVSAPLENLTIVRRAGCPGYSY
jgi:hypothetical protein